jgi:hypothetical protein
MKNKHKTIWQCAMPKCSNHTSTLHEILPGSRDRKLCEKYHLQVPLCPICHKKPHHEKGRQIYYKKLFCTVLGIRYGDLLQAFGTLSNPLLRNEDYLKDISGQCLERIKSYEM